MDIVEEMDRVEKVEISDELVEILKEHFREDIEQEKREKAENEKVAAGISQDAWIGNQGNLDNGESDRV
jgi:hypothetical protein